MPPSSWLVIPDPWPWSNSEREYRSLFPAALESVAEILDVARGGIGAQLREAGLEPAAEMWPPNDEPDPSSPAGKLVALREGLPHIGVGPSLVASVPPRLLGLMVTAVRAAGEHKWADATERLKEILRLCWTITDRP
ncbi:hypothetical protein [Kitasatospora sp. NPDC002965]|uniref:hypothetical protein n=1 Tax=Kitasatospora sp. NPDC002965 TaxID=3154775 RepID=UPI0033B98EB0